VEGVRRVMDIDDARSLGLTIVDLSDDWAPYIFWPETPGMKDYKENAYLASYVALANDRIDVDGVALPRSGHNFHEVYGIPPTLSVLRRRFLRDEGQSCYGGLDLKHFAQYHGPLRVVDPAGSAQIEKRYQQAHAAYRQALRLSRVKTLEALLASSQHKRVAQIYRQAAWRREALRQMQKRLVCEGLFGRRAPRSLKPGLVTWAVREALRRFEKKHNIYGWGMIFQSTAEALGRSARENNYESLKRVLAARVISAAGIIEDGSSRHTFRDKEGKKQPVPDLVQDFSAAILRHLGLNSPDRALAFIKGYAEGDFKQLLIAVPLPPLPEYYGDQLDLSVEVDRGDIWYDLPFDQKGRRIGQPRAKLPTIKILLAYNGQKFPLVRWRTTIGGWQPELRGGEEYYKYKISDVGPRIWKHIVAGPVWVPPKNTPSKDLVKYRSVGGVAQPVVAQSAFGPGYASAYGLVAAYHVTKAGHDNQIRTHGSVNYMSILQRSFSHGCHRLLNYQAVRLFSFVLRQRSFVRQGQTKLAYTNRFEHKGEEFQINLHTRGYYYELTPPIRVNVLEGRVRGKVQQPVTTYVKKPSVVYQEDLVGKSKATPDKRRSGGPQTKKAKGAAESPMSEEQPF
jgi:hypothetical protein